MIISYPFFCVVQCQNAALICYTKPKVGRGLKFYTFSFKIGFFGPKNCSQTGGHKSKLFIIVFADIFLQFNYFCTNNIRQAILCQLMELWGLTRLEFDSQQQKNQRTHFMKLHFKSMYRLPKSELICASRSDEHRKTPIRNCLHYKREKKEQKLDQVWAFNHC